MVDRPELIQRTIPPQKDCGEHPSLGRASSSYHYIWKGNKNQDTYPEEACEPWYHKTAQIDGLKINTPGITGDGSVIVGGEVSLLASSLIFLTQLKKDTAFVMYV